MAIDLSQPRKVLPVDVLEDDGLHTRGYVQNILHSGDCIVYFDCEVDPVREVHSAKVFEVRYPRSFNDPIPKRYGSVSSDDDELEYQGNVEALISWSPDAPKRWYSGRITELYQELTIDITNGPDAPRKALFNPRARNGNTSDYVQHTTPRRQEQFSTIHLSIPEFIRDKLKCPEFVYEWEKVTWTLVKSVDLERGTMTVLVNQSNPLSPFKFLSKVADTLDKKGKDNCVGQKRPLESEDTDMPEAKRLKSTEGGTPSPVFCRSLMIPDLLVKVFRQLGLSERHILRGVCSLWKDLLESTLVSSTLCLDETGHPSRHPFKKPSFVDRFRYLSRLYYENLTSVCIQCTVYSGKVYREDFLDNFSRIGSTLAPHFKHMVLTGKLMCHDLVRSLERGRHQTVQIKLRNLTLFCLDCFGYRLHRMHVWIKSVDLDLPNLSLKPELTWEQQQATKELLMSEDRQGQVWEWLRSFLAGFLDQMPCDVEEEKSILAKAATADKDTHRALTTILYTVDREFFRPSMLKPKKVKGRIRLAPCVLRKATLHLFGAVFTRAKEEKYRCADPECSRKHSVDLWS